MAFDGVVISNIVHDLKERVTNGRIYKIQQPEADEIILVIKNNKETLRLLISADASLPLVYITEDSKESPLTAPTFCMLLRKHIGNGRIVEVSQPGFERIVELTIEHLDEMGDLRRKRLIVELMGKHSNIIFVNEDGTIIDSIKHISNMVSSVREVLPGREYVAPPAQDKRSPYDIDREYFVNEILGKPLNTAKAIYQSVSGVSPLIAEELCFRARVGGSDSTAALSGDEKDRLWDTFFSVFEDIKNGRYAPCIVYDNKAPKEYSAIRLSMYSDLNIEESDSISMVLREYYKKKAVESRIKQKSVDLRKIVSNAVQREAKKLDLQLQQLKDTEDREKFRIYGELLNTYGYSLKGGEDKLICINYYDDKEVTIPLQKELTVNENSQKYFAKYNKKKRTFEALTVLKDETKAALDYLLSVQNSLSIAESEADLAEIKEELIGSGYIKSKGSFKKGAKRKEKSKPFHFISSDGYHMYVGRNNLQNDYLSFEFAKGNDMWFHAKKMPGSHVIVKRESNEEIPDSTYEEAARLAAYFSSGKTAPKVEIDYTEKKQLKKPPKANPGFVIYHTNYSMVAEPDISGITEAD